MRAWLARFATRDHIVWSLGFWATVLTFAATLADLVPPEYAKRVSAIAALLGFISAKLGNSPLPGNK